MAKKLDSTKNFIKSSVEEDSLTEKIELPKTRKSRKVTVKNNEETLVEKPVSEIKEELVTEEKVIEPIAEPEEITEKIFDPVKEATPVEKPAQKEIESTPETVGQKTVIIRDDETTARDNMHKSLTEVRDDLTRTFSLELQSLF